MYARDVGALDNRDVRENRRKFMRGVEMEKVRQDDNIEALRVGWVSSSSSDGRNFLGGCVIRSKE